MKNTVTIERLAHTVAQLTGCTEADALLFVKETFALAAEQLLAGEAVTINGIGTFSADDGVIHYAPDAELSESLNAPFAAFKAIEVDDEFELEEERAEETSEEKPEKSELSEESEPSELSISELSEESEPSIAESVEEKDLRPYPEPAITDFHDKSSHHRRHVRRMLVPLIMCIICFVVGFCLGWALPILLGTLGADIPVYVPSNTGDYEGTETVPAAPVDTICKVSAPVESVVVTDTITTTRYLTTMARKHYGQTEYWVYIYLENADKLGHPDRLDAGTVVVIPPASKYGLTPGNKAKISEASRRATEIYGRFK